MNILVIHETDYLRNVVYDYQTVAELLSAFGNNVYVIDYPTFSKRKSLFDLGTFKTRYHYNIKKTNKKRGITLIRIGNLKISGLGRLSAFFTYYFAIKKTIEDYHIDHIIMYSVLSNGLQALYLAYKNRVPVLYRPLDPYYLIISNKFFALPAYVAERIVNKLSNQVLTISPAMNRYAIKMGADPKSTSYLPTGADSLLFYPTKKDPQLMKKYNLHRRDFIMIFAGTLFNFSGLDDVIVAMPKYLKRMPNLKLLIVGRGEQQQLLVRLVKKYHLKKNVIFTGFQKYENLPKYLNLADVGINPFHPNSITNLIFPGKIYQYTLCGKPTIASKLTGMVEMYPPNKQNCIFYFDNMDEFFTLVPKVIGAKVEDSNPSIQKIAKFFERKLKSMKI